MLSAFRFFVFLCWLGVFASFSQFVFLRVAGWKIFRERTFVFGCRCWSCVFSVAFCFGIGFMIWRFAPESVWKILLMSGLVFLGSVSLP